MASCHCRVGAAPPGGGGAAAAPRGSAQASVASFVEAAVDTCLVSESSSATIGVEDLAEGALDDPAFLPELDPEAGRGDTAKVCRCAGELLTSPSARRATGDG